MLGSGLSMPLPLLDLDPKSDALQAFSQQLFFECHLTDTVYLNAVSFSHDIGFDTYQTPPDLFPAGIQSLDIGLGNRNLCTL